MNHSMGLALEFYDTVTDIDNTLLADHVSETGQEWLALADEDTVEVISNALKGADNAANSLSIGLNLNKAAKKIQYRVTQVVPGVITSVDFIALGEVVTAGQHIPDNTLLVNATTTTLGLFRADGAGGSVALTDAPSLVTVTDTKTNDFTMVIEITGTIIKAYLADDPGASISYDITKDVNLYQNGKGSRAIGVRDLASSGTSDATRLLGTSVEY